MEPEYLEQMIQGLKVLRDASVSQLAEWEAMPRVSVVDRYEILKASLIEMNNSIICQALDNQDSHQSLDLSLLNITLHSLFTAIEKGGKRRVFMDLFYRAQVTTFQKELDRLEAIREKHLS